MPSMPTAFHEWIRRLAVVTAMAIVFFWVLGQQSSDPVDIAIKPPTNNNNENVQLSGGGVVPTLAPAKTIQQQQSSNNVKDDDHDKGNFRIPTKPPRVTSVPTPLPLKSQVTTEPTQLTTTQGENNNNNNNTQAPPLVPSNTTNNNHHENSTNTINTNETTTTTTPSPTTTTTTTLNNGQPLLSTQPSAIRYAAFPQRQQPPPMTADTDDVATLANSSSRWAYAQQHCQLGHPEHGQEWFPTKTETSWQQRAPYVMLIGAPQSGVPTLANAILQHPKFAFQSHTDHFFAHLVSNQPESSPIHVWKARQHLYIRHYYDASRLVNDNNNNNSTNNNQDNYLYSLDASDDYFTASTTLPRRILCVCPWTKLIVMVRNPIDRLLAQFRVAVTQRGWRTRLDRWIVQDWERLRSVGLDPTHTEMTHPESWSLAWTEYLRRREYEPGPMGNGLYALAMRDWIHAIQQMDAPQPQLLVLRYEDWKERPQDVLDRIWDYLELSSPATTTRNEDNGTTRTNRNQQQQQPKSSSSSSSSSSSLSSSLVVDADTRDLLQRFYQPYSQLLCQELGWDVQHDCWPT